MPNMPANGQLTIKTDNNYFNEMNEKLLQVPAGDYVSLSIIDTGCGMDKATQQKIFEPFYSTKGANGTGLGLSQVHGFVKRSNGTIKVYSEVGEGSEFILYFPRFQGKLRNVKTIKDHPVINMTGNETILIVDDESALLNLCETILKQHGYSTFCAESAKQALEILETESIDLLLSDIIMPEMDGYELASVVQKKYPDIKIQLASGFSDNRHEKIVDDSLHKNIIHKPFISQVLLQKIRSLLDDKKVDENENHQQAIQHSTKYFKWNIMIP